MKDEFTNRFTMFTTARDFLQLPASKAVWFGQHPLIFTTKVAAVGTAITDLGLYCQKHGVDISGAAKDKDKEETDVENVAHRLGRFLVQWFRDQGDETNATKCDLRISDWRILRDQTLIAKAREIRDLAIPVGALPAGGTYGIISSVIQQLTTEVNEYEEIVNLPATSIAQRKALTLGLRAEFNKVEAAFDSLDDIILGFAETAEGRALIAAYNEARIIRDAGHGAKKPAPVPPTT